MIFQFSESQRELHRAGQLERRENVYHMVQNVFNYYKICLPTDCYMYFRSGACCFTTTRVLVTVVASGVASTICSCSLLFRNRPAAR